MSSTTGSLSLRDFNAALAAFWTGSGVPEPRCCAEKRIRPIAIGGGWSVGCLVNGA